MLYSGSYVFKQKNYMYVKIQCAPQNHYSSVCLTLTPHYVSHCATYTSIKTQIYRYEANYYIVGRLAPE